MHHDQRPLIGIRKLMSNCHLPVLSGQILTFYNYHQRLFQMTSVTASIYNAVPSFVGPKFVVVSLLLSLLTVSSLQWWLLYLAIACGRPFSIPCFT